jgi:periplasmic copper chaperone A
VKPTVFLLAPALASLVTAAAAHDDKIGGLEEQPWAHATPKGAKTVAGYLAIKSTASGPDRLTGGPLAGAGAGP